MLKPKVPSPETTPDPAVPLNGAASPGQDGLLRYVLVLAALIGTTVALFYGKEIFLLVFIAGIFSFLLLPFCRRLERLGLPTWAGAAISCVLMIVLVLSVISFLGWQYAHFGKDLPGLKAALIEKLDHAQGYFESRTNVSQSAQTAWIQKEVAGLADSGGAIALSLFSTTGAALATIVLIPIFTFFLLLLKGKFRVFFDRVSSRDGVVLKVVESISVLSRKWLKGVLTVMLVLSVLNSVGFLLLGLKYAILLGVTAAILNVIPYVGPWIGALMPVTIALLTKDSAMYAVGAAGVILITQFIDNNFVTPKVVGSSVSINPLASIVALIAGGMIWGVVGLILAIPITGMLKLVFDEIPAMQPWGFLLGEEKTWPKHERIQIPFGRPRSRSKHSRPNS